MTEATMDSLFPEPQEQIAARIDAEISWLLLGHAGGPLKLSLERNEREVLRLLRYMRGLANAMTIRELEGKTGLSPRDIKQAVRTLRVNFHLPIGSSKRGADGGYYVMLSAEDEAAWSNDVLSQIRAEAEVLRAAVRKRETLEKIGQLILEAQP